MVSWNKCSSPSQSYTYLGLSFDSIDMSIALPDDKLYALHNLHNEQTFFWHKNRATKRQFMRLGGVLAHCSKVVNGGRTFSRRIIDLLKGLHGGNPRIYLNEAFKLDLNWWISWSRFFNCLCPIVKYNYGYSNYIVSHASMNGYRVTFNSDWLAGYFNTSCFPADGYQLVHSHHWCNVFL